MKGKGKGMQDLKADVCPLQFPDIQPVDHTKDCTKFTNILERSEEDGLALEELGSVQTDLETLLAAAGKRLKLLESEIQILASWQDKKDKKMTPGKPPETPTPGKRGKGGNDDKPSKKFKDSNGKSSNVTPPPPSRPKKLPTAKNPEFDFVDSPVDLPKLPKNDAVNRFWVSVEPYCSEITADDLRLLEELMKTHDDESEYFKIPTLGKHYSEKWAEEDMKEEQLDGTKMNDKKRNCNSNSNHNSVHSPTDTASLLKKAEANNLDESPFGHLTQRLVAALIEENIMTPIDDNMTDITGGKESAEEAPAISPRMLAKQLNIVNPAHLEKRIKRELEEQGLIEMEEKVEDNPDDEILMELRRKQMELKAISQRNVTITKSLYKRAKGEMARQEMRKKLTNADAEVMEAYRKIQAAKQKKKTPTKKEKDAAYKALKERESIMKALEV